MAKNTVKLKCQQIWQQAYKTPIILYFTDFTELQRARFTLYDSMRPRAIASNSKLTAIRADCEIVINKSDLTLTVQAKAVNPFHDNFGRQLDLALEDREPIKTESDLETESAFSLQKLEKKLASKIAEAVEPINPTSNPYYTHKS